MSWTILPEDWSWRFWIIRFILGRLLTGRMLRRRWRERGMNTGVWRLMITCWQMDCMRRLWMKRCGRRRERKGRGRGLSGIRHIVLNMSIFCRDFWNVRCVVLEWQELWGEGRIRNLVNIRMTSIIDVSTGERLMRNISVILSHHWIRMRSMQRWSGSSEGWLLMKGFMSILEKDCRKRWMSRIWKRNGISWRGSYSRLSGRRINCLWCWR